MKDESKDILEGIGLILPSAIELEPHLDAAKDHFLTTLEINAELDNVTVVDGKGLALLGRRAEANVVEKGARGAFDVLDIPLAVFVPKLAMPAADDLALEANVGSRGLISGDAGEGMGVAF